MSDQIDHRGACGCGWQGPWRTANSDAKADAKKHTEETGCTLAETSFFNTDDLMPHERS